MYYHVVLILLVIAGSVSRFVTTFDVLLRLCYPMYAYDLLYALHLFFSPIMKEEVKRSYIVQESFKKMPVTE